MFVRKARQVEKIFNETLGTGRWRTHDEIVGYLELLLKEDKVQKFKYGRHVYWRATVNILKRDS